MAITAYRARKLGVVLITFLLMLVGNGAVYANGDSAPPIKSWRPTVVKPVVKTSVQKKPPTPKAQLSSVNKIKPQSSPTVYHRTVGRFNGVEIDGNFAVTLTSSPRYWVKVSDPNLNCVQAWVDADGLLILRLDQRQSECRESHASAQIALPYLAALYLSGNAEVTATNIQSGGLVIEADDYSSAHLTGDVAVAQITTRGSSNVSVRWVDSDSVDVVQEGYSAVYLAGVSRLFQARLLDCSRLDAKYLRTDTTLVHTQDQATAEVLAKHYLYAFATGASNIYYYKTPTYQLESSRISGNVLQMSDWR